LLITKSDGRTRRAILLSQAKTSCIN